MQRRDLFRDPGQVQRSSSGSGVVTQGPGEGTLSLGELEAPLRGVEVRSTSRCGTNQVRYDGRLALRAELDGHPQQLTLGGSFTTTDAGPDRARSWKIVVGSHQQVSLACWRGNSEPTYRRSR